MKILQNNGIITEKNSAKACFGAKINKIMTTLNPILQQLFGKFINNPMKTGSDK